MTFSNSPIFALTRVVGPLSELLVLTIITELLPPLLKKKHSWLLH